MICNDEKAQVEKHKINAVTAKLFVRKLLSLGVSVNRVVTRVHLFVTGLDEKAS